MSSLLALTLHYCTESQLFTGFTFRKPGSQLLLSWILLMTWLYRCHLHHHTGDFVKHLVIASTRQVNISTDL